MIHDKILLLENNLEIRSMICMSLEKGKYQILDASSEKEVLLHLKNKSIGLIISDTQLNGYNGIELLAHVKSDSQLHHIPFFILSVQKSYEEKIEALKLGADEYLGLPLSTDEIFYRCKNAIEIRKSGISRVFSLGKQIELLNKKENFLMQLKEFIEQNYSNEKLALSDFTSHFNMGSSNLQKYVKQYTGKSLFEILSCHRLERANELLRSKSCNVSEAVYSCGFKNTYYFTRKFKLHYGVLPSQIYRNIENN